MNKRRKKKQFFLKKRIDVFIEVCYYINQAYGKGSLFPVYQHKRRKGQSMKKFKYPWEEKGRSMVEMLGVLAVIGVLTVTGIVGMQYAMQIHKENETLNVFSVATAGARTANLMQNYIYSCDGHYPCTVKPKSVISTKYDMRDTDFSTAVGSPMMVRIEDTDGYTVRIRGISKEVCESIKSGYWGETCAGVDDAGTTKYRTANCKSLKELDCSQFENANSGLIRRSALQEEISKNLKEPTVNYAQAGYSALVLYYNDKAFADTDTFIGEEDENYPDPDDTDPEISNPSHSNSDPTVPDSDCEGYLSQGECCSGNAYSITQRKNSKACCEGNSNSYYWNNGACCNNDGVDVITGKKDSKCTTYPPECQSCNDELIDASCCNSKSGQEWHNNTCCQKENGKLTGKNSCGNSTPKCGFSVACDGEGKDAITGKPTSTCCVNDLNGVWASGVCCKVGSATNLNTGKKDSVCCTFAGGTWKGTWCCKTWANRVVGSGGQCGN